MPELALKKQVLGLRTASFWLCPLKSGTVLGCKQLYDMLARGEHVIYFFFLVLTFLFKLVPVNIIKTKQNSKKTIQDMRFGGTLSLTLPGTHMCSFSTSDILWWQVPSSSFQKKKKCDLFSMHHVGLPSRYFFIHPAKSFSIITSLWQTLPFYY